MNNNYFPLPETLDLMEVDDQSENLLESLYSMVETLDYSYPYRISPDRPEPDAFHQGFILPLVDLGKRLKRLEQRTNYKISHNRINESYARRQKVHLIQCMQARVLICRSRSSGRTGLCGRQLQQIGNLCDSLISSERRREEASALINNCIDSSRSYLSSSPDRRVTYLPLTLTSQGHEGLNPLSSSSSSSSNVANSSTDEPTTNNFNSNPSSNGPVGFSFTYGTSSSSSNFNSNPTTSGGPVGFSFTHGTSSSSSNFNSNPTTSSSSSGPVGFRFTYGTSSSSSNFNSNPTTSSSSSNGPVGFSFTDGTSSSSSNFNSNTTSSSPARFPFTLEMRQDANLILNGDFSSNNNALTEGEELETINYSSTGAEETMIEEGLRKMWIIDNGRDGICAICLEEMKGRDDNNGRATIGCSHTFHFNCILEWTRSKHTCPLCSVSQDLWTC